MNCKSYKLMYLIVVSSLVLMATPVVSVAQLISVTGSGSFQVSPGEALQAPDGFKVKSNASVIFPSGLVLSSGDVLMDASTAIYKIYGVGASTDAVFYGAVATGNVGLTIRNGSSGTSDFTLKLDPSSPSVSSSIPGMWEVSRYCSLL